jgi:hypothetical protein
MLCFPVLEGEEIKIETKKGIQWKSSSNPPSILTNTSKQHTKAMSLTEAHRAMAMASIAMMGQVYDDVVNTGLAVPPKSGMELIQLLEKAIFQDDSSDVICVGVKREDEEEEAMPEIPVKEKKTKKTKKSKKTAKSAETSSDEAPSDAESDMSSLSDGSTMSKKEAKIAMLTSEYNSLASEWSQIFPVTTKKGTYEANVAPSKVGELTDAIKGIKSVTRKMAKENKNSEKAELKAEKEAAKQAKVENAAAELRAKEAAKEAAKAEKEAAKEAAKAAKEAAKAEKAAAKAAKAEEAAAKKAAKEAAKAEKEAAKAEKEAAKAAKAEEAAAKKATKEAAKAEKEAAKAAKAEEAAAKKAAKAEKAEKKAPKEEATNQDTFEKEWNSNVEEGVNTPKKEVAPKPYVETPGCKYNTEVDHGDCLELEIWDLTQEEDVEFAKRIYVKSTKKYYGVDDEDSLYELGGEEAPAVFSMDDVDLVGTWDDEKKIIVLDE